MTRNGLMGLVIAGVLVIAGGCKSDAAERSPSGGLSDDEIVQYGSYLGTCVDGLEAQYGAAAPGSEQRMKMTIVCQTRWAALHPDFPQP